VLRIPEADPIEFLVERKFPNYQELRTVITTTRECDNISRDFAEKQLKEVKAKASPESEVHAFTERTAASIQTINKRCGLRPLEQSKPLEPGRGNRTFVGAGPGNC